MVIVWAVLGTGIGTGLWVAATALWPARASLAEQLAALNPATAPPADTRASGGMAAARTAAARLLQKVGLPTARTRRDLRCLQRGEAEHLAEQATGAVIGMLAAQVLVGLTALAGAAPGVSAALWLSLIAAGAGMATPTLRVWAAATEHRAALRTALSALLDLTVISLAGGAGLEQSLDDASSVGTGRAAARLRETLTQARITRTTPWQALAELGERVGVAELQQLAATVGLAGTEGARVRASLTARAAAMRSAQLTDAEAEAASATERMSLPVVGLFAGYLLLIGYPAVAAVLGGL